MARDRPRRPTFREQMAQMERDILNQARRAAQEHHTTTRESEHMPAQDHDQTGQERSR